jgi:hypothetical protein
MNKIGYSLCCNNNEHCMANWVLDGIHIGIYIYVYTANTSQTAAFMEEQKGDS